MGLSYFLALTIDLKARAVRGRRSKWHILVRISGTNLKT